MLYAGVWRRGAAVAPLCSCDFSMRRGSCGAPRPTISLAPNARERQRSA